MFERLTPVVKNFLILNVLAFLATALWDPRVNFYLYPDIAGFTDLGRYSLAAFFPTSKYFYPVQVVSNMFMHGGIGHLFFNMLSLFFFGSLVESTLGSRRFFGLYFACGIGALLVYWLGLWWGAGFEVAGVNPAIPVLGASGAIYGVLLAHAYIAPDTVVYLLIPPIPLKMKYLAPGLIALDLWGGFSGAQTGTAHFAHVGGALIGLVLVVWWRRTGGLFGG